MYFSLPDWSPLPHRVTGLGFRSLYIAKHLYIKWIAYHKKGFRVVYLLLFLIYFTLYI